MCSSAKGDRRHFFLIGIQADKFHDVTERIYGEGHEIGNHTFTHPDISNISRDFMRSGGTQSYRELFASRLGIAPSCSGLPIRSTPSLTPKTRSARLKSRRTWATSRSATRSIPTTGGMIRVTAPIRSLTDVLDHLPPCAANDIRCGNIILMHDGGGNREQTVLALPQNHRGDSRKGIADCSALPNCWAGPGRT